MADAPPLPNLRPGIRSLVVALLLVFGAQLWLIVGQGAMGSPRQQYLIVAAAIVSAISIVHRNFFAAIAPLREPTDRARRVTMVILWVIACAYFFLTAHIQGRQFTPKWHDESQILVQTQMLAKGHLWMPAHPVGDFFETFYLFTRPVYAAQSFPGAALLYVPGVWLHLPYWLIPLLAAGATVAMTYRVIAELLDGWLGLLAAALMISLSGLRGLSIMALAQIPALLLGLFVVWGWLRWRHSGGATAWAVAIGLLSGWAAITRPVDALCFAIPVMIAMATELRPRSWGRALAAVAIGVAPFLLLQLIFNFGVTGSVFKTPFQLYNDQDQPGLAYAASWNSPTTAPTFNLEQKRIFYETWTRPAVEARQKESIFTGLLTGRLSMVLNVDLPQRLLLILVPVGLLMLWRSGQWVLFLVLPLFVTLYLMYPIFIPHYAVMAAPALLLVVLAGIEAISATWPRAGAGTTTFLSLVILILSVTSLREFNRLVHDETMDMPYLAEVNRQLAAIPDRAVVLFHFPPGGANRNVHEEPVYNTDVAWPDDARVIRARDLGPRNPEIFRYYADRQPDRVFYIFEESTRQLTRLGTARDLANSAPRL